MNNSIYLLVIIVYQRLRGCLVIGLAGVSDGTILKFNNEIF